MELQSIDLSLFTKGNDCEKSKFASDLLDSISRHGVVRVVNHGVSEAAVSELWEMVRTAIFSTDAATLQLILISRTNLSSNCQQKRNRELHTSLDLTLNEDGVPLGPKAALNCIRREFSIPRSNKTSKMRG